MSILNPIKLFEQSSKLATFSQVDSALIMPTAQRVLEEIIKDRNSGNLNRRLTNEHDIIFNLPLLYYLLPTKSAQDAITIFNEWFCNPPKEISSAQMNNYINMFLIYMNDCVNFQVNDSSVKENETKNFFNLVITVFDNIETIINDKTHILFLEKILDIVSYNIPKEFKEKFLDSFVKYLLKRAIDQEPLEKLINSFVCVTEDGNQWNTLIYCIIKKLFEFSDDAEYLLNIFYSLKSKKNYKDHAKLFMKVFNDAVDLVEASIKNDTVFLNTYDGSFLFDFLGDFTFLEDSFKKEGFREHLQKINSVFTRAHVSDEWVNIFISFICYLMSFKEIRVEVIHYLSDVLTLHPWLGESIIASLTLSDLQSLLNNSVEWLNLLNTLTTLNSHSRTTIIEFANTKPENFVMDEVAYQKLLTFEIINHPLYFHSQFCWGIEYFNSVDRSLSTMAKDINSSFITLALSPLLMKNTSLITELIEQITGFLERIIKEHDENLKIYVLFALIECRGCINLVQNERIMEILAENKQFCSPEVAKIMNMTLSVLKVPVIKPENINSFEEDQESFLVSDKIMSFVPTEDGQTLIVRHKYGITKFIIKDTQQNDVVQSEETMKPNCPRRCNINIEDLGPFPPEPVIVSKDIKSNALRFLYSFGLANCENIPKKIGIKDFTEFDHLCMPLEFVINVSCVKDGATTIKGEPEETENFNKFYETLGTHFDTTLCRFKFEKKAIGSEISIIFTDSELQLDPNVDYNCNALIVVNQDITNESNFIITLICDEKFTLYSPLVPMQKRMVDKYMLPRTITAFAFTYYAQSTMKTKSYNSGCCRIFDSLIERIDERTNKIREIVNNTV